MYDVYQRFPIKSLSAAVSRTSSHPGRVGSCEKTEEMKWKASQRRTLF